jgi:acetyl-CoA acetyltransferase
VADTVLGWRFINGRFPERYTVSLGETAERVAERYGITREAQDAFALREPAPHGARRRQHGRFDDEIVPVEVARARADRIGRDATSTRARKPRSSSSRLRPAFRAGRHGDRRQLVRPERRRRGAADHRGVSERAQLGLRPLARIAGSTVAGVEPDLMGLGPVPATTRSSQRWALSG